MLKCIDQTGEHEHSDGDNDEDEAEVLVGLVKGVHQALKPHKVTDHFEDPQNSHNPYVITLVGLTVNISPA